MLNVDGLRRHSMANRLAGLSVMMVVVLAVIGLKGAVRQPSSAKADSRLAVTTVSTFVDRPVTIERPLLDVESRDRRLFDRTERRERSCGF
jgi:hypothetical protein